MENLVSEFKRDEELVRRASHLLFWRDLRQINKLGMEVKLLELDGAPLKKKLGNLAVFAGVKAIDLASSAAERVATIRFARSSSEVLGTKTVMSEKESALAGFLGETISRNLGTNLEMPESGEVLTYQELAEDLVQASKLDLSRLAF